MKFCTVYLTSQVKAPATKAANKVKSQAACGGRSDLTSTGSSLTSTCMLVHKHVCTHK